MSSSHVLYRRRGNCYHDCMNLSGAVAVITGGSRGLGLELRLALEKAGATTIACASHPSKESGIAVVDVRKQSEVKAFVEEAHRKYGKIDILINNAGWVEQMQSIDSISPEDIDRCIDTNVKGPLYAIREVLPIMRKQQSGTIVTIGSRAGTFVHPGFPVYCATKFAVRGFTEAVAKDMEEASLPIRCFSVSPGGIDTVMRASLFGEEDSKKQQSPSAVAALIVGCLQDHPVIPNGADVHITSEKISAIIQPKA